MLLYCRYFLFIICPAIQSYCYGQAVRLPNGDIGESVIKTFKSAPLEKIFVHTSQNTLIAGQTLWYKTYTIAYGKPSQLSNIVYVNLAKSDGKVIARNKHQLTSGSAGGNIDIPDTISTGWYQLQAYTAWTLNFGNYAIYQQKIFIKNLRDKAIIQALPTAKKYHIKFYPEGGDLLDGAISAIAFKATDEFGSPVHVTGQVVVNGLPIPTKFTSVHDGMGSFKLETYAANSYSANILYPDHHQETVVLPIVKRSGIGLAASNGADFITLALYNTFTQKDATIVAMQTNGLSTIYPLKLSKGKNLVRFKKGEFANGIARFTVLNADKLPVAERLVFINNHNQINILPVKDSLSYDRRSANLMSFTLKAAEIKPRTVDMSVSITDADEGEAAQENILSGLLLTSELKGNVNNPAYYFASDADSLQQQLDLVMLTNGWRHFKWEKLLNDKPDVFVYQPERFQFATGQVESYDVKKQLKLKLMVLNPDSTKRFMNVEPDSLGRFFIDDNGLYGKVQIIYSAVNDKNSPQNVKLTFNSSIIDTTTVFKDSVINTANPVFSAGYLDTLTKQQAAIDLSKNTVLKEVKIRSARVNPIDGVIADHVKTFSADRTFDIDFVHMPTIPTIRFFEYIKGRFPGLEIVDNNAGGLTFFYRGHNTIIEKSPTDMTDDPIMVHPPYFYIDEARVMGEDMNNVVMSDIALIRFVPPPVWFAPLNGGPTGAMLIYTKNFKDDQIGISRPNSLKSYFIQGYTLKREYSEPDYANRNQPAKPDMRTTLYWNPSLKPDKDGNFTIRFYNSDRAKRYRIDIQGMDKDGNLASYTIVK